MTFQNPVDAAIERSNGKTLIVSNGSKRAGEAPDPIEKLFDRLDSNALDPGFYHMSLFQAHPWEPTMQCDPAKDPWRGAAHFWGNFLDYSHVFSIITRDETLTTALQKAIDRNIQAEDFVKYAKRLYTGYLVMRSQNGRQFLLPPGEAELAELNALGGCQAHRNGSRIVGLWSDRYLINPIEAA